MPEICLSTDSLNFDANTACRRRERLFMKETKTRVTFFLPAGTLKEEDAIEAVVRHLRRFHRLALLVTGFTHSNYHDPVFFGEWWDALSSRWVGD